MKYFKFRFTAFLIYLLIAITSCSEDNTLFPENDLENIEIQDNKDISEDGEITLYRVQGENLEKIKDYKVTGVNLQYQKDTKKHQEIWELVKKIVPLSYRDRITEFIIYSGESNGTAGYVYESSRDLSKWKMGIAIDFAYDGGFNKDGELAYTIIHEFAHILTLGKSQVDSSINENDCNNFFTGEGCSRNDSFINQSYNRFWKDIWSEFINMGEDQASQDAFYDKYSSRFLTPYSATNPGEDCAEVFAVFVTRKGGANGNSMAEQKISLMYTYPEFVKLRDYIRGNVASSDSKKSGKIKSFLPEPGSWKKANTFGKSDKLHQFKN